LIFSTSSARNAKKKTAENVGKLTFSWAASRAELKIMTAKEVPNLVVLWKIALFEVQSSRRQLGHLGPHGFQPGSLGARLCQPSDTVVGIGKGQGARAIIVHTEEIAVARFQPLKKPRVEPAGTKVGSRGFNPEKETEDTRGKATARSP
jgi:hypothetical protein